MPGFAIVEFVEEKTVEVVPVCWIETKDSEFYCYWPLNNISNRIRNKDIPDKQNWSLHGVRIFAYADDYERALKKSKKAELTSSVDTDSEPELPSKRVREMPDYLDSDGDDENMPPAVPSKKKYCKQQSQSRLRAPAKQNRKHPRNVRPSLPQAPSFHGNEYTLPGSEPSTKQQPFPLVDNWHGSAISSSPIQDPHNTEPTATKRQPFSQVDNWTGTGTSSSPIQVSHNGNPLMFTPTNQEDSFARMIQDLSTSIHPSDGQLNFSSNSLSGCSPEFSSQHPRNKINNQSFQTSVLVKLDSIIENQKEMLMLLRQQRVNRGESSANFIIDDVLPKPLSTKKEMDEFCMRLNDESFNLNMVSYLASLCGHNVGDTVRRMMTKLGTNGLWSCYSFKGRKEKDSFKSLNLCNLIIKACVRTHKNVNSLKIEEHISETLKHAPHRPGGARSSKHTSTDQQRKDVGHQEEK